MALIKCPECQKEVSDKATACISCGHPIAPAAPIVVQTKFEWSPTVAFVLSLFIPGAGQMYKGQNMTGVAWLIGTVIGYFIFIIPGLIIHFCCVINALFSQPDFEAVNDS